MELNLATLQVGQQVGIMSSRGDGQGLYTVVKVNKLVVVLARKTDGYQRVFSVKRGYEKNSTGMSRRWPAGRYASAYVVDVAAIEQQAQQRQKQASITAQWAAIEQIASTKRGQQDQIAEVRSLLKTLEQLVDSKFI